MAVSREEARDIGKEIADKVLKTARGCRCGVAMWDARTNMTSLEAVINFKRSDWLEPLPRFMESILLSIEKECGVDMSKPKELSRRLQGDIKQANWSEARVNLALLQGAIAGPLEECATEGPPLYREIGGKKHKLVGTEKDLDKAELWATRMWEKSGEKITVIPVASGYALYREE